MHCCDVEVGLLVVVSVCLSVCLFVWIFIVFCIRESWRINAYILWDRAYRYLWRCRTHRTKGLVWPHCRWPYRALTDLCPSPKWKRTRVPSSFRNPRCLPSQPCIVGHATASSSADFTLVLSLIVPLSLSHLATAAENLHHACLVLTSPAHNNLMHASTALQHRCGTKFYCFSVHCNAIADDSMIIVSHQAVSYCNRTNPAYEDPTDRV